MWMLVAFGFLALIPVSIAGVIWWMSRQTRTAAPACDVFVVLTRASGPWCGRCGQHLDRHVNGPKEAA